MARDIMMDINLLDELLAFTETCRYRFLLMISLFCTATRMEKVLASAGDWRELDELVAKRNELLHTIDLIDRVMADYYLSDGRIN